MIRTSTPSDDLSASVREILTDFASALLRADPHTLQLTVTCTNDVPGAEFVRNFEKAADMLMDLHEAEAGQKSARL